MRWRNGVLTISALAAPPAVLEGAFALQAEEARPDTATWLAATHVDGNDEEWLYILPSQTRVAGGGWVWVAATAPLTQIGFSPGDNQIGGFAARVEIDLNGVVYHTYRSNSDLVDLESRALPLYLSIAE